MKARAPKKAEVLLPVRIRAQALVEADIRGDRAAAARVGVSDRTIRRWRVDLATDAELAGEYASLIRKLDRAWKRSLVRLVVASADRATELVPKIQAKKFRDLLATIETVGGVIVQAEALAGGTDDYDADELPHHREGPADPADPAATPARTKH